MSLCRPTRISFAELRPVNYKCCKLYGFISLRVANCLQNNTVGAADTGRSARGLQLL